MTDAKEWRPSVGERVLIKGSQYSTYIEGKEGVVKARYGSMVYGVVVADHPVDPEEDWGCDISELHPLPAPPSPRPAWEVLREVAELAASDSWFEGRAERRWLQDILEAYAKHLEAAAAPKPPSLAEAVREYLAYLDATNQVSPTALHEALAREEGK